VVEQVVEVTVDEQNRIVIPSSLQDRLKLSPGMILVVEEGEKGEIRLRIQAESPPLVDKGGVLVARTKSIGDLMEAIHQGRDRRVLELSRWLE